MRNKKEKVLIVDDMETNRTTLEAILSDDYEILQAENGAAAIDILYNASELPSIVLLDIMMPEMDGFEVLNLIKSNTHTVGIPVVFITAADIKSTETRGLKAGAVDYISKPFNPDVVKVRVDNQIELKRYRNNLERTVEKKVNQLLHSKEKMLETLATVIEYRNLESGHHVKRTSILARKLIRKMLENSYYARQLNDLNYEILLKAVPIHDIGKIGIPDNILLKPGRLSPEEFEIVKTHTTIGSNILDTLLTSDEGDAYLKHCRDICRYHHERFSGTGYPDCLVGEAIPLSARIVSIIDVYDALVNSRVYKPAFPHEEAVRIIQEGSGHQFDPKIAQIFLEINHEFATLPLWSDRKSI